MDRQTERRKLRDQNIYQLAADVPVHKSSIPAVYDQCVETVLIWLEKQIAGPIPREPASRDHWEIDQKRRRVHCCAIPEKGIWSSRLIYPDFIDGDGTPDVRYDWTIDMTLHRMADKIMFGIRVLCTFQPSDLEFTNIDLPLILPEPVALLARRPGLRAARLIDDKPWYIDQKNDLHSLKECLTSPNRMLPLVVMTQLDDKQDGVGVYPLNERELAKRTFGFAHVACLSRKLENGWLQAVGPQWAPPISGLRIYWPGLKMDGSEPRNHPCFVASPVVGMAPNECDKIVIALKQSVAKANVHWDHWYFYSDAKLRQASLQRRRLQADMKAEVTHVLQDKESEWSILEQAYLDEIDASYKTIDILKNASAEKDEEILLLRLLLEESRDQEGITRHANHSLQESLVAKTGVREDQSIPILGSYEELSDWVDQYLDGRLILHKKAKDSIEKAKTKYCQPQLVYHALLLLAGPYRNMKLGIEGEKEKWDSGLASLHLVSSPSMSEEGVGEFWEKYHVPYPDIRNQRLLDMHLKKGTSTNQELCLRIYFFWDEKRSLVVVGNLPNHLPTRAT